MVVCVEASAVPIVSADVQRVSVARSVIGSGSGRWGRAFQRWRSCTDRGRKPAIANVAIARELAGWCWSRAVLQD